MLKEKLRGKTTGSALGSSSMEAWLVGLAAMLLTAQFIGCGGEPGDELAASAEPLMNGSLTTNPYAVQYCGGGTCCTGTFVGPYALLSSRHCSPSLVGGATIDTRHYANTPDGEPSWFTVKRVLRQKKGTDGLLLIELVENVGAYTSVCQEIFEPGDRLVHYGAGATNASGSHSDGKLRVSTDGVNTSDGYDYTIGPRHGSKGDSGGPYMYDNSVVGVHFGYG